MTRPRTKYIGFDSRLDWHPPELALLAAMLPPGRALDIGCGHGTESIFLAAQGWTVVAFDHDPNALSEARTRARQALPDRAWRRLKLLRSKLKFKDPSGPGMFDLVIERLVYVNQFRDPEDHTPTTAQTYRESDHWSHLGDQRR